MGAQLMVYHLSSGAMVVNETVFSGGIHVHGMHALQTQGACLLAVHGDRMAQVSRT